MSWAGRGNSWGPPRPQGRRADQRRWGLGTGLLQGTGCLQSSARVLGHGRGLGPWLSLVCLLLILFGPLGFGPLGNQPAVAAPGLCVGPVCGDQITRSAKHHWQLRLRVLDQQGHLERLVVDCRTGELSPFIGPVERGYAEAVARRVCRLAGEA